MYDIEQIKQQFRSVIQYSQCIPDPQVDWLFEKWEASKEKFIQRFGGLIYEWPEPIEFVLDPKEKHSKAMDFIDIVQNTFNNDQLAEFLDLNIESFFENKVSNTCNKQIPEGMKLIKAFKFFENNKQSLRNIQDLASQLIQEDKIKGTLCFSVHPLDFLSSSENTYNWRSCHALDGEYRAGNLSYMVDNTTFMVYLKGVDNTKLHAFGPDVIWNSKKWRMLIHASEHDDIIFAGRQYPFNSKSGIDTVLNIYNNLMQQQPWISRFNKYGSWNCDYIDTYESQNHEEIDLDDKYIIYARQLIGLNNAVKSGVGALNYNDILSSTCYKYPYYAILNPGAYFHIVEEITENPLYIGGEVKCLHCGKDIVRNPETMRCDDCEVKYGYEENDIYGSCGNCGARICIEDAPWVGDSEYVCEHCYANYCLVCDVCGEAHYSDRMRTVTIDEDEHMCLCPHCYYNN